MLEGRQFNVVTDNEIFSALDAAVSAGSARYNQTGNAQDGVDYFFVKNAQTDLDNEATKEANDPGDPPSQRAGSALWEKLNQALEPYKSVSAVVDAVSSLPPDSVSPAQSWLKPILTVGGVLAVFGVGYLWTRQKPRRR